LEEIREQENSFNSTEELLQANLQTPLTLRELLNYTETSYDQKLRERAKSLLLSCRTNLDTRKSSAFAEYSAKAKQVKEVEESESFEELEDDKPQPDVKNKEEAKVSKPTNGSTVSPSDRRVLSGSSGASSPSLLSAKRVTSKKGLGAQKVSNDFFADWDLEEKEEEQEPEEEEPKVEEYVIFYSVFSKYFQMMFFKETWIMILYDSKLH
jgi:hypothetical protein